MAKIVIAEDVSADILRASQAIASSWVKQIEEEIREHEISSPIEQRFYFAWRWLDAKGGMLESDGSLCPQHRIGRFVVDFYFDAINEFVNLWSRVRVETLEAVSAVVPKIVIELDGHEFHEKTPEQVERDKKRERYLTHEGYTVVRFSGREVFRDAEACVSEVHKMIAKSLPGIRRRFYRGEFGPIA